MKSILYAAQKTVAGSRQWDNEYKGVAFTP